MEKNKNVPKLRFPEFTGEWEEKKLGEVTELLSGYAFKGDDILEVKLGKPILRGINITEGYIRHSDEIDRYFNGKMEKLEKYLLKEGDLVIGMDGSKVGKNVAVISKEDEKSLLIQRVARIRASGNTIIGFIFQQVFSTRFQTYVDVVNTSSAIPHISAQQINDYIINFPIIDEQQKIASFLTAVDEKLTQLKKKKTLLEQYKKGIMQKLFSQELRFKDNNNQDFPDWQEKTLGEISDVRDGTHESPQYYDYGFPFITSKNLLKDGNIDFDNVSYINEHDFNRFNFRSKVDVNDILFAMIGTIGNPVLVSKDGFAIKNVALIKEKGNLLNIFLIHYMKGPSINQQFFEQNTGGTQKFLSLSVIKNLIVAVPSLPEQQKIATFLSSIDEKISHSSAQIEKMETWKKGLLQQMFV